MPRPTPSGHKKQPHVSDRPPQFVFPLATAPQTEFSQLPPSPSSPHPPLPHSPHTLATYNTDIDTMSMEKSTSPCTRGKLG